MKDRVVEHANRYKLTPVSGTSDTYDLEAAPGVVTEAGTDLNKATLLKDTTAALYGLGPEAVPDEVLQYLSGAFVGIPAMKKLAEFSGVSVTTTPVSVSLSGVDLSGYTRLQVVIKLTVSETITEASGSIYMRINNNTSNIFYGHASAESNFGSTQADKSFISPFPYVYGNGVAVLDMVMRDQVPIMTTITSANKQNSASGLQHFGGTIAYAYMLVANYSTPLASLQFLASYEGLNTKGATVDMTIYGG